MMTYVVGDFDPMSSPGPTVRLEKARREVLLGLDESHGLSVCLRFIEVALFRLLERVLPVRLEVNGIGQHNFQLTSICICN